MIIGVWGDSIVYGQCDAEGLGWVGRLRNSFPIDQWKHAYNRGVCGDTSLGLLKRFPSEAESIQPDVVVFAIGINDSKIPKGTTRALVSIGEYENALRELVRHAKTITKQVFVISATNVDDQEARIRGESTFSNTSIKKYNQVMKRVAEEERVGYIDVFDVLSREDLHDGLHPNAQGYEKLFATIKPQLVV